MSDVCAAATPREAQGNQFEWSADGRSIAYFKPMESGFGLRLELHTIEVPGGERRLLLSQQQVDHLFPATPYGNEGNRIPPPRKAVGFEWGPDGSGILLHSDRTIAWLDRKSLQTRNLVAGKEVIGDVQLSPDGRWVGFTRDHNLWVVSVAGGTERPITRGGNETLLKGELDWLYPAELGTKHGYAWSPDSSRVAYFEFNLKGVAMYAPPFGSDDDNESQEIDYPTPGENNPVARVLVAELKEKSPAAVSVAMDTGAEKNVYLPRLQWLPDSRHVAVERLNRAQTRLDLLIADGHTGASHVALTENDTYWINLADTLYFLKGAPQFIWSSERTGYRHLYLYSLDGKLVKQLTDGNWEVTALNGVNEQERKIYFTSTEKGPLERSLYFAGFDGQAAKRLSNESGSHEATFAPDFSLYVDNFSTAVKPWVRTIYRSELAPGTPGNAARLLTLDDPSAAGARKPPLKQVDFLSVKTHDGLDLNGMMIRPTPFSPEKKYPAIVYVYGGPGRQAVHDAWDGDISMWQQMLVQHGFIVFAVDNRGTSGRGHAFEEYIHLRFEGQEMTDQIDAARFLQALPYVDPARTGIWGRGFGGALTVRALLHPPVLFKAGFAVAPIVNWTKYDSVFTERYLGDPVKNQDGYLASSPLDEWQRYKGPMLVGQGLADLEVHPDQTMELQEYLVEKKKYVEVALFPGQPHTIDKTDACTVLYQRAADFFDKSLLSAAVPEQQ